MKISARNIIKGKVKSVKPGVVNTEVVIEMAGGTQIVSIITKESAEGLKLEAGKDAYAIIKASNVIIGVD
jgi:molybdopterin-binding protein